MVDNAAVDKATTIAEEATTEEIAAKVKVFGAFISGGLFEDVWDVWDVEEMGLEARYDRMGIEMYGTTEGGGDSERRRL